MEINDVICTPLQRYKDARGWLMELFRTDSLDPEYHPAMAYISLTKPGLVRGPHEHLDQADYFAFLSGFFRVTLWDNRSDSSTFENKLVLEVGEWNPMTVLVPKGVVHAYQNVGIEPAFVINLPNRLYKGLNRESEVDEVRHEDDEKSPFKV